MNLVAELLQSASKKAQEQLPWRVSTRDLSRQTTKVLGAVYREQRPAVVTYRGAPAFLVLPLDKDRLSALILGSAPQFKAEIDEDEKALAEGRVESISDLRKELAESQ
jgi:prevent-host-death family protein